jgi:hypothetical protein
MAYNVIAGAAIGIPGLNAVYTAGALGYPWVPTTGALPSVTTEPQLGEIKPANDVSSATLGGGGEFIFLAVPVSTTVTAGLFYSWDGAYKIVVVPTSLGTQGVSGFPIALAINAVASSTSVQGTWFQIQGRGTALKTAVQVVGSVPIYTSGVTAGRIKILGSAFRGIIGARTANQATVTSTTSTVAIYMHRPSITAGI